MSQTIPDTVLLERLDLELLDLLQDDLPLIPRPWQALAKKLDISETEMIERIKNLVGAGIIRGITPVLEAHKMGLHAATLVAFHVPAGRVDEIAALISRYPEVSHNFQRDHYYSLWFTIAGMDTADVKRVLDEIRQQAAVPLVDVLDLPTEKKVKIDVRFPILAAPEHPDGRY